MKILKLLIVLSLAIIIGSCSAPVLQKLSLEVESRVALDSLSSASGIIAYKGNFLVSGDDSPWIYLMDKDLNYSQWIRFSDIAVDEDGHESKAAKSDVECMELIVVEGEEYLVMLSSGSKKITRDTALIVQPEQGKVIARKNIRPLFEAIKKDAGIIGENEINIEGLAVSTHKVYLFHRGNISGNLIISFELMDFFNYLSSVNGTLPPFAIHTFTLPAIDATEAGFSGACMLPGDTAILFTASVEKTTDVYNDGLIAGSFIGVIGLSGLKRGNFLAEPVKENDTILPVKLEGIAVTGISDHRLRLITVADNDNGTSDLLVVLLNLP